jgi:hypothetical protein
MSDRGVFVTAFTTVVLIVAGAFALPQFFPFELIKSLIFVAIAILVFFGEDRYSYMLGIVAPVVGWVVNIITGGFFDEFAILWSSVTMKSVPPLETPLHGLAILTQVLLLALSWRAWQKEVTGPFFGKVFGVCVVIAVAHAIVMGIYIVVGIPTGTATP